LGSGDEGPRDWFHRLRFLVCHQFLASKIRDHAEAAGIDLAKCRRVLVYHRDEGGWLAAIDSTDDDDGCNRWQLDLNKDGELLWFSDSVKNEVELRRLLAEEKELQELLQDYCDYRVRPQIY
jgi:hypothetical protein